ncbi:hypothetical protein GCM10011613_20810 [Cellvibrio zantedeschiae]|uniref:Ice-binding protein C-terminal domain-containing protein n=1 Tax=Cellvibrio zantedeschiae TaxID=1237077 RepID=A0ABQ3B5V8_9GAMM|nr:PEP-CTERM sorting domain-containing protein [Cellvibrio zantedeschiae]GGY75143.1 hypothetical protein GCM10011613_20810 [Cellvibrio zantedeschiae]
MQFLKIVLVFLFFTFASSANALLLSDVREFNAPLVSGRTAGFNFNLANQGYNHLTDTITNIKLSFNFREIVQTEEDLEHWEDMSTWEFIIFYSWIFDGRAVYADIDTGPLTFESSWIKTYTCQYSDYVDGEEICRQNLDLSGEMSTWFVAYTDNLWLADARLDVEIDRVAVPEPSTFILCCLGLFGLALKRYSGKLS